jgi:replicative DNA helicase
VRTIIQYFNEYKDAPTLDVLKIKVNELDVDILKTTVVDTLKDVMKQIDAEDLQYVKDQITNFCKNQKLKNAILSSVELLKEGKYDDIKNRIDDALKAGVDKNIGHNYMEMIGDRFQENRRNTIETPWEVINEIMDGGLGKGELGIFVAPAGIGKSMALVNIAAHGVSKGLNVIYYTLELNENYVGSRFDSYYTGIPSQDLKFNQAEVVEAVGKLKGKLVVKYYPTKTATISMLSAHIEKCMLQGIKPDLIVVDYADLLRDTGAKSNARHDVML